MNPKPRLCHRPASSWKGCLSGARLGCGAHVAVDAGFRQALGSQAGLACPRRLSANSTLGIQHGLRLPEGQDPRLLHPPHPPPHPQQGGGGRGRRLWAVLGEGRGLWRSLWDSASSLRSLCLRLFSSSFRFSSCGRLPISSPGRVLDGMA